MKENIIKYYLIDYEADDNGFVSKPHSHQHYEIFYFEKGNANHFIDFEEYPIRDNSLFLISYNQVHYITANPNTYNFGYVLSIDQEIMYLFGNELMSLFGKFSQAPAFYLSQNELFTALFNQIQKELQENKPKSTELAFSFIKILLTYIWREKQNTLSGKGVTNNFFLKYLQLVENNYLNIKWKYAELLSITTKQLNRVCKEVSNQTALSVIHQRVNLEAKRQLFYSENQVKDICYNLGFEDTGHFNNFFKKMNNKTPTDFRAEMSQIFNGKDFLHN